MKNKIFSFFILASLSILIISSRLYANDQLFINDQSCSEGGNVIFTVSVNDTPSMIHSLGFEVQFDSSVLSYINFNPGNLTESMNEFNANYDASDESVVIGGFSYEENKCIPLGSTGTIIELTFSVTDCQNRDLMLTNLIDNIEGWSTQDGHLIYDDIEKDFMLSISDQTCTGSGDITFSISVDNTPIPIDALGFEVHFDTSSLNYKSLKRGNLTANFNLFDVNLDPSGNSIVIGGLSYEQGEVIPPGSTGTIAQLTFSVINCKNSTLILANPIDNLEDCITKNGKLVQKETSSQSQITPWAGGLWGATTSTLPSNSIPWGTNTPSTSTSWNIQPFGATTSSVTSPFTFIYITANFGRIFHS